MRLGFQGSRSLTGSNIEQSIHDAIVRLKPDSIITSAEPDGVCRLSQKVAKQLAIPLKVHFLNRNKYASGCFEHRSIAIQKDCDYCIFIHDGVSKGTSNEIKLAKKMKIPHEILVMSNEYDEIGSWDIDVSDFEPFESFEPLDTDENQQKTE